MNVRCDVYDCGYFDEGFCRQKTLVLNRGMCSFIYNKRNNFAFNTSAMKTIEREDKDNFKIEDGKEIKYRNDNEVNSINSRINGDNSKEDGRTEQDE